MFTYSDKLQIFQDDILRHKTSSFANRNLNKINNSPLIFGKNENRKGFVGAIQSIRVYDKAFSIDQAISVFED